MANKEDEYKKLRSYLNKVVRGKNTDAILRSVSSGPTHLINNVEAVNDSLYIVSAKDQYLDSRLGDKGVVRPAEVGLSDEVFRDIGIEITNRKQVRDLVHQLLRILYGEIFTRATSASQDDRLQQAADQPGLDRPDRWDRCQAEPGCSQVLDLETPGRTLTAVQENDPIQPNANCRSPTRSGGVPMAADNPSKPSQVPS